MGAKISGGNRSAKNKNGSDNPAGKIVRRAADRQYNYCNQDNFYIYPSRESADFYAIGDVLLEEVYIGNKRKESDRNCCGDQYYFHPILLIPADYRLRIMYALDWWETKNSTTADKDQSVKLKYYYEQ